tara:strand:- start:39 stop:737 length:699 start_codon:yes stop_codon:yes gene_type:complete
MRAFEFLIEYGSRKGVRHKIYRDGGKPDWYEKAVKLKTDNPRMSAEEISRQVGISNQVILCWLAGYTNPSTGRIYNDNPPFTEKDFPNLGNKKFFNGEKPWWYEQAVAMRKQGMSYQAISNKLSTPEERITLPSLHMWLVKGRKHKSGNLVNPDAPFKPRPYNTTKIDTALLKELIVDKYTDEQIIELIADEKGDKIANQVRAMLPKLRQALQPGTEVRNKVTGDDITGFVQ